MSVELRRSGNMRFHVFLQVLTHFQDEEVNKNVRTSEEKHFRGILDSNTKVSICKRAFPVVPLSCLIILSSFQC